MLISTLRICIILGVYLELTGRGLVSGEEDILVLDIKAPKPKPSNSNPSTTPVKIGSYGAQVVQKTEAKIAELSKLVSKEAAEEASYFLGKLEKPAKPESLKPVEPVVLVEEVSSPEEGEAPVTIGSATTAPGGTTTPVAVSEKSTAPATTPGTKSVAGTPVKLGATKVDTEPEKVTGAAPKLVKLTRRESYSARTPYFKKKKSYSSPEFTYKMLEILGEGSYGVVWKASKSPKVNPNDKTKKKEEVVGEVVAVKSTAAYVKKDDGSQLTTNEAKKMALEIRLWQYFASRDPRCKQFMVNYFEYFHHVKDVNNPMKYAVNGLSMELAEYGSLQSFVANNFVMARKFAPFLMLGILKGLVCFHQEGYSHRDLKPANILVRKMINGDPHAVISDLGLAALNTENPNAWGTRIYAAPEYWYRAGGNVDPPTADMFAVGAIFYYLLTGEHPTRPSEEYEDERRQKKLMYDRMIFSEKEFNMIGIGTLEADFLQRLCWYDPAERLTLKQALQHPYVNSGVTFSDFLKAVPLPKINPRRFDFIIWEPKVEPDFAGYAVQRIQMAALKGTGMF